MNLAVLCHSLLTVVHCSRYSCEKSSYDQEARLQPIVFQETKEKRLEILKSYGLCFDHRDEWSSVGSCMWDVLFDRSFHVLGSYLMIQFTIRIHYPDHTAVQYGPYYWTVLLENCMIYG